MQRRRPVTHRAVPMLGLLLLGAGLSVLVTQFGVPQAVASSGDRADDRTLAATDVVTVTVPVAPNFPVMKNLSSGGIRGKPAIAFDGTHFLAVWSDANDIWGARISPEGDVLDPQGIAISVGGSPGIDPSVGFDGTNFVVVWASWTVSAPYVYEVYGARVNPDGSVLDPGGVPLTTGGNAKTRMLSIAYDGTNFLVAWRTMGDVIRGARINSTGGSLVNLDAVDGFRISSGGGFYPAVAYGLGTYLVTWHAWGTNGLDILGARVDPDGTVTDPGNFVICDALMNQDHNTVAFDGTHFLVVWHDWRPEGSQIYGSAYGARVGLDGTVLDDPAFQITDHARGEKPVQVACDGSSCLVVWDVEHDVAFNWRLTDVYGRRIAPDGSILDTQGIPISAAGGHQFGPVLGYGDGHYLVAWGDIRDGEGAVWAQMLENQVVTRQDPAQGVAPGALPASAGTWVEETYSPYSDEAAPTGLAFAADNAYAFGRRGYHYNGASWSTVLGPKDTFFGSWASSPDDIWIGMWCRGFYHYDGDAWSHGGCWAAGEADWAYNVYGIWGIDEDEIWASTDRGRVLVFTPDNGKYWTNMDTPTGYDLWDIWGLAADQIYAVGDRGTLLHYDGATWQAVAGLPSLQSLNAIWGSGADDIFVAGDWGTLLHYDGAVWQAQTSGTLEHLVDLWGRDAEDVYAVGLDGTVLHYDGAVWTAEPPGLTDDMLSVWGVVDLEAPSYTIWAATRGNKLVKKTLPAAAFRAFPTSGIRSVTAVFTNTSTAGYTSASWDFGDGAMSSAPSPTHTYDVPGAYTVTLQVEWPSYADTLVRERYVRVYTPVQASFWASPTIGTAPLTVVFTNTTSGDYDTSLWDFGDGITSTQTSPTHTYTTADSYAVSLTASGPGGSDTWADTIAVLAPVREIYLPLVFKNP